MKKLIIFDYDGVIIDSFPEVYGIYKKMCLELNKDFPEDIESFKKIYGQSSSECYSQLKFNNEDILKGNEIYKREIKNVRSNPFDGIGNTLEELSKNYMLVIISSSYREDIEQKLEHFNLLRYFEEVLGRESTKIKRFEKTEAISNIIKKYGVLQKDAIMIGDRNVDFIEGRKAGLENILLVDYGWGYDLTLIPDYEKKVVVNAPKELIFAVDQYF